MAYEKQWQFFTQKVESGNLAHAYIFAGQDTQGVKEFVKKIVELVGCKFPDISTVLPGENAEITIEQIREVQKFLAYKSYYGGIKMLVVENAEKMTKDAQDCFLKNLEEPKGQTVMLLLTANPAFLLPTIASRCQVINFLGSPSIAAVDPNLLKALQGGLSERFAYAKNADLEGDNFEKMLRALQNHFRNLGVAGHQKALKLLLDLEHQAQISNINKKLALEVLFLTI